MDADVIYVWTIEGWLPGSSSTCSHAAPPAGQRRVHRTGSSAGSPSPTSCPLAPDPMSALRFAISRLAPRLRIRLRDQHPALCGIPLPTNPCGSAGRSVRCRRHLEPLASKLLQERRERLVPGLRLMSTKCKKPRDPKGYRGFFEWWAWQGLNLRPLRCQHSALPLSYTPTKGKRASSGGCRGAQAPNSGPRGSSRTAGPPPRPDRANGRAWTGHARSAWPCPPSASLPRSR